jgi:hypothetical protein
MKRTDTETRIVQWYSCDGNTCYRNLRSYTEQTRRTVQYAKSRNKHFRYTSLRSVLLLRHCLAIWRAQETAEYYDRVATATNLIPRSLGLLRSVRGGYRRFGTAHLTRNVGNTNIRGEITETSEKLNCTAAEARYLADVTPFWPLCPPNSADALKNVFCLALAIYIFR